MILYTDYNAKQCKEGPYEPLVQLTQVAETKVDPRRADDLYSFLVLLFLAPAQEMTKHFGRLLHDDSWTDSGAAALARRLGPTLVRRRLW